MSIRLLDESGPDLPSYRADVMERFARLAQSYGEGEYYARRREAVMRVLGPYLARANRILDLGCGNGRYLAEFVRAAPNRVVVGVDLLPEMLAEARQRVGGDAALVRADASHPPFRDVSVDLIFASHVLPFVTDLEATVRALARCLRVGGLLVATVGQGRVREVLREMIGEPRWEEFRSAVFGRVHDLSDSVVREQRHREALLSVGFSLEAVAAGFEVGWPAIEQWVHLRWMPVADSADRASAERLLAELRGVAGARRFALEEQILLGQRS